DVQRREIWEANYRAIEEHNQRFQEGNATYKMGMNQFGDLVSTSFLLDVLHLNCAFLSLLSLCLSLTLSFFSLVLQTPEEFLNLTQMTMKQVCAADQSKFVATVKDWMSLPSGNEQALEDALVTIGPVAITIDSTTPSFQFYQSGVFYDPQCTNWKQNHAMVVVGFGTEGTDNYWIIKNR
ncbi:CATK protein, partial [Amia calva]|nr:CATK protein [Amia calva]